MGRTAVAIMKATHYHQRRHSRIPSGPGPELLLPGSQCRIQVEHPVTELVSESTW